MNHPRPLHLSYSASHGDGGIAFAVSDLLNAQQAQGVFSRWLTADRYSPIHRDRRLLSTALSTDFDILHLHGLWRSQTRIAHKFLSKGFPTIVAPHGMMDEWAMAHSSWKKEIAWHLWESESLRSASCIQALCTAEANAIRNRLPNTPVAVIPNGVNTPQKCQYDRSLTPWHPDIPAGEKVLLFLGRFHNKKGIDPLMSAWQSVLNDAKRSGWWLVFIGFGDDGKFESQLKSFPVDRCFAYGPVFAEHKVACFQHASAFVLSSYSEGLPMAALEAMSYGLPCLLSSACNLPEAFQENAAIHADPENSSLIAALQVLFGLSDSSLRSMGAFGRDLVKRQFHWKRVAEMTIDLYRWIFGGGQPPESVRFHDKLT